ncbi:MAG: hypothetical protein ABL993_10345 [Vicinamibacterales bacterium]
MVRALLVLILLLLVARAFWRVLDGVIEAAGGTTRRSARTPARGMKLMRDPVCGTFVPPGTSRSLMAGGTMQYFCSEKCLETYRASPHV